MITLNDRRWPIGLLVVAALTALASLLEPGWGAALANMAGLTVGLDQVLAANSASRGQCVRGRGFYFRRAWVGGAAMLVISLADVAQAQWSLAASGLAGLNFAIAVIVSAVGAMVSAKAIALIYPYRPPNSADDGRASRQAP